MRNKRGSPHSRLFWLLLGILLILLSIWLQTFLPSGIVFIPYLLGSLVV